MHGQRLEEVLDAAQSVSWNSLSEIYTSPPFFMIDFDIFGIREPVSLEIENTEDPLLGGSSLQDETSKEDFETNKMERKVSKFEELRKVTFLEKSRKRR